MGASQSSISPAQNTPGKACSINCGVIASNCTPPALLMASVESVFADLGLSGRVHLERFGPPTLSPTMPSTGAAGDGAPDGAALVDGYGSEPVHDMAAAYSAAIG